MSPAESGRCYSIDGGMQVAGPYFLVTAEFEHYNRLLTRGGAYV